MSFLFGGFLIIKLKSNHNSLKQRRFEHVSASDSGESEAQENSGESRALTESARALKEGAYGMSTGSTACVYGMTS